MFHTSQFNGMNAGHFYLGQNSMYFTSSSGINSDSLQLYNLNYTTRELQSILPKPVAEIDVWCVRNDTCIFSNQNKIFAGTPNSKTPIELGNARGELEFPSIFEFEPGKQIFYLENTGGSKSLKSVDMNGNEKTIIEKIEPDAEIRRLEDRFILWEQIEHRRYKLSLLNPWNSHLKVITNNGVYWDGYYILNNRWLIQKAPPQMIFDLETGDSSQYVDSVTINQEPAFVRSRNMFENKIKGCMYSIAAKSGLNTDTLYLAKLCENDTAISLSGGTHPLVVKRNTANIDAYTITMIGNTPIYVIMYDDRYNYILPGRTGISVNDVSQEQLGLYPNPTRDYLNLSTALTEPGLCHIYSMNGELIHSQMTTGKVDTRQLTPGAYWIRVELNSKVLTQKFVKVTD